MKLRIQGNSIRLRLNQREVAELGASGRVEDQIDFGGAVLRYGLLSSREAAEPQASFEDGRVSIAIPHEAARYWVESDEVGISAEQVAGGACLSILIEKDFQCLHRASDAEAEAFPNPLAALSS
jgi:hypothetical protein